MASTTGLRKRVVTSSGQTGTSRITEKDAPQIRHENENDDGYDSQSSYSSNDSNTSSQSQDAKVTLLVDAAPQAKWKSFAIRASWSLVMVFAFLFIVFYLQQAGCVLLVFACQFMMYKELIQIGRRNSKERELGWLVKGGFQLLYWYWFFLTTFIVYGQTLEEHIYFHRDMIPKTFKSIDAIFDLYVLYSFGLYALGLVAFVLMLKKQHYKYQFQRFAHSHCVLLAVVVQSSVLVSNMFQGMIWFLLPCLLVITNDIMAYIFGFTMGKTPLIKLSPKKTWEGFIGGWVSTVFLGFAFSRFLIQFPLMVCPTKGIISCKAFSLFW